MYLTQSRSENPLRHRVSLGEAVAMQGIGLLGETIIFTRLPAINAVARASIARFILFDALGLVMLILALWLVNSTLKKKSG